MIAERINALREEMRKAGIDACLVPTNDFHGSEYVGDYFKCRRYLSGFTGSAGTLVVTADMAGLWTDGRYFLQAEEQLEGTGIDLYRMGQDGVPKVREFLADKLKEGQCLGFDGRTVAKAEAEELKKILEEKKVRIDFDHDLPGQVWTDRPSLSCEPVTLLDEIYTGKSRKAKLADVREKMEGKKADCFVLTSLDDIAWLLNIRGGDVECNPVVLSYVAVLREKVLLFANEKAFGEEVKAALAADGVRLLPYNSIYQWIRRIPVGRSVWLDGSRVNYAIVASIPKQVTVIDETNPTQLMKAVKNPVEVANIRKVHVKDGVAVTRFMYWLKQRVRAAKEAGVRQITDESGLALTEIGVAKRLEAFRAEQENYRGPSFETIAGFGPHGAVIHYSATPETDCGLCTDELLLVDSGGQYPEGTTDITRTFVLGEADEERRKYFTMVLRGNLNLAAARFLHGCCGLNLDYLCREPLWEAGLDYNHGTGHGVGCYLNVHEGPNGFRWKIVPERRDSAVFEAGMVTSDEPGFYLEGRFGIRHENLIVCCEGEKNEYGQFMYFDTLTMAPFDLDGIDASLMSERERRLLNEYHGKVYETIAPYLPEEERQWLKEATRAV
ncbi:MAG: aminopeptidase P family protein [Lachnospiraceae bacterium]|jgi:Xaa-Pro aminopeptidase|nr:aminopeptidase P family protein [Lachnospiraceae bacterium]